MGFCLAWEGWANVPVGSVPPVGQTGASGRKTSSEFERGIKGGLGGDKDPNHRA